jgi:hypothetical protein
VAGVALTRSTLPVLGEAPYVAHCVASQVAQVAQVVAVASPGDQLRARRRQTIRLVGWERCIGWRPPGKRPRAPCIVCLSSLPGRVADLDVGKVRALSEMVGLVARRMHF